MILQCPLFAAPVPVPFCFNRSHIEARVARLSEITPRFNQPKGSAFAVMAAGCAASRDAFELDAFVKRHGKEYPQLQHLTKSAMTGGGTATWANDLVWDQISADFIATLRPRTITGRMGLRSVPFSTRIAKSVSGASVMWVGAGTPSPLGRMTMDATSLAPLKISTIIAATRELVNFAKPNALETFQADLTAAIAQATDAAFIDPTVTAVAGTSPASVTNAAPVVHLAGSAYTNFVTAAEAAFAIGLSSNVRYANSGVWVMNERTALGLSLLLVSAGVPAFPNISLRDGGTWIGGLPVIASDSMPIETDGKTYIALLSAESILFASGPIDVSVSLQGMIQMASDPAGADSSASFVSLWQSGLCGIRVNQECNWEVANTGGVVLIDEVAL